jgi:hypothetical protein
MPQNDPDLLFDFFTWLRMSKGIVLAQWKPDEDNNAVLVPSDATVDVLLHEFLNG